MTLLSAPKFEGLGVAYINLNMYYLYVRFLQKIYLHISESSYLKHWGKVNNPMDRWLCERILKNSCYLTATEN